MPFYSQCECKLLVGEDVKSDRDCENWDDECSHTTFSIVPEECSVWCLRLLIRCPSTRIDRWGVRSTIPISELQVGQYESIHTISGTEDQIINRLKMTIPYPTPNGTCISKDECEVRVLWNENSRGPMIGRGGSHINRIRQDKNIKIEIHNRNCPGESVNTMESSEFLMLLRGPKAAVIDVLIYYYKVNAKHNRSPTSRLYNARNGHACRDMPYGGYGLEDFCNPGSISKSSWRRSINNFEFDMIHHIAEN